MRTLVVDDSSSIRGLLGELLRERNYEVTDVESAEDALHAHEQQPFDLMLIDWTLPGMSGLDLCRRVREMPGGQQVFIFVISGRTRTEDLVDILDAGASDFLSKPLDPEVLSKRLLIAERAIARAAAREAERQNMEARLAFADRMTSIGTLAAGVAHELNNPLMYVLSNLRVTREDIDAAEQAEWLDHARQQLDEAIQGAVRMQNIVRDLKTFSRVDDERRGNVVVQNVLESSINICWNEIRHRATLERDFKATPPVDANESRLGQVFLNLLINAAQAMPDRPVTANRITVRSYTDDDGWAVIEVTDNGVGIAPDRIGKVFDPFFTTKGVSEGTGLGLSICRSIVRGAGGTIGVQSRPDRGTTFVVRLPASARPNIRLATQPPAMAPGGAQARVIVVDDEPLVGRSIRRALRGHDVEVFLSGKEAIERLCTGEPVDVVFCDLLMPEMSGMEVFAKVAAQRPDLASRFVFMTGGAFTPEAREFVKDTSLVCLDKPFELHQIRDLVRARAEEVA